MKFSVRSGLREAVTYSGDVPSGTGDGQLLGLGTLGLWLGDDVLVELEK